MSKTTLENVLGRATPPETEERFRQMCAGCPLNGHCERHALAWTCEANGMYFCKGIVCMLRKTMRVCDFAFLPQTDLKLRESEKFAEFTAALCFQNCMHFLQNALKCKEREIFEETFDRVLQYFTECLERYDTTGFYGMLLSDTLLQ